MKIYKVGGCIRDQLLDLPYKDTDWVVVGATTQDMLDLGYSQVGKDFPVFLHPKTKQEYALARTERKTAPGHKGFTVHAEPDVTLEQDLQRRDLTVNAMAMDPDGNIIDPYNGQKDLQQEVLRHVSDAFTEDPLRILRLARFAAALDFTIAPETLNLARSMVAAGALQELAPERIWQELHKVLKGSRVSQFISTLRQLNALAVLFPELEQLFGVPQTPKHHPEVDTGQHTLLALDLVTQLSQDPLTRFAVLLHDLGKGTTPKNEWPRHIAHEARGVPLVKALCQRYRVPTHYEQLAINTCKYHLQAHQAFELRPTTLLKLLEHTKAFRKPEDFRRFVIACEADSRGRKGFESRPYPQANFLLKVLEAASAVSSKELVAAGLTGQAIGEELRKLRIKAIRGVAKV